MALAKEFNPRRVEIATWLITAVLLVFIVYSHLLPALLAGLLMYELVHLLAARINLRRFGGRPAKIVAVALLASLMATLITFATIGLMAFFHSDASKLPALLQKMAVIIEGSRSMLPDWLVEKLPTSAEGIQTATVELLRTHASEVQTAGKEMGRTLVHVLIGLIIGAMISLREVTAQPSLPPPRSPHWQSGSGCSATPSAASSSPRSGSPRSTPFSPRSTWSWCSPCWRPPAPGQNPDHHHLPCRLAASDRQPDLQLRHCHRQPGSLAAESPWPPCCS